MSPPSTLLQSKERKGSNFAIWQPSLLLNKCRDEFENRAQLYSQMEKRHAAAVAASGGIVDVDEVNTCPVKKLTLTIYRVTHQVVPKVKLTSIHK